MRKSKILFTVVAALSLHLGLHGSSYQPLYKSSGRLPQTITSTTPNVGFGYATVLSPDGNWLGVGTPSYPYPYIFPTSAFGPGLVSIYHKRGESQWEWMQDITVPDSVNTNQTLFYPTPAGPHASIGYSLAFNYNGSILAFTGPGDDQTGPFNGAVWIYTRRSKSKFFSYSEKLSPVYPGVSQDALTGWSFYDLALNYNGDLLAVGAQFLNNAAGGIVVFQRHGQAWNQVKFDGSYMITPPPPAAPGVFFGANLDFSRANGEYLVANNYFTEDETDTLSGTFYVYKKEPITLLQETPDGPRTIKSENEITYRLLTPDGITGIPFFPGPAPADTSFANYPIIISPNGKYIASFVSNDISNALVWIFEREGDSFTQVQTLDTGVVNGYQIGDITDNGALYGAGSLAFSCDGETLAVGVYSIGSTTPNSLGEVQLYKRKGDQFVLVQRITDPVATVNAWQGFSCSLSADGKVVAFGAPGDNGGTDDGTTAGVGAVYIWNKK
jgi:hypothetical protein